MGAPAIEVRQLSKSFGTTVALDRLDLVVHPGEVSGFLGPNGAGKTTTIRTLLGLIRADQGSARVLGLDPWRDAVQLHPRVASRARRRRAVADPLGRGDPRPARPDARRGRRRTAGAARRALPPRPDHQGARLLQGQPAEGRAGGRAVDGCRALPPRRADGRARPADGGRLPRRGAGAARPGRHRAAEQPHPRRGGAAVRHRDDHPRRPGGRGGQPRRAAPPHPLDGHPAHLRQRGAPHRWARRARRGPWRPRPAGRRGAGHLRGRRSGRRRRAGRADLARRRRHHVGAALARGPLPAPLRGRHRGPRGGAAATSGSAGPS